MGLINKIICLFKGHIEYEGDGWDVTGPTRRPANYLICSRCNVVLAEIDYGSYGLSPTQGKLRSGYVV